MDLFDLVAVASSFGSESTIDDANGGGGADPQDLLGAVLLSLVAMYRPARR